MRAKREAKPAQCLAAGNNKRARRRKRPNQAVQGGTDAARGVIAGQTEGKFQAGKQPPSCVEAFADFVHIGRATIGQGKPVSAAGFKLSGGDRLVGTEAGA